MTSFMDDLIVSKKLEVITAKCPRPNQKLDCFPSRLQLNYKTKLVLNSPMVHYFNSDYSVSQQVGCDPLLCRGHLLFVRQNLVYSCIRGVYGSPYCDYICFVGRQLPTVENH